MGMGVSLYMASLVTDLQIANTGEKLVITDVMKIFELRDLMFVLKLRNTYIYNIATGIKLNTVKQ